MAETLVLCAIVLSALSGVPGLFISSGSDGGQRSSNLLLWLGALLGLSGAAAAFLAPSLGPEALLGMPPERFKMKVDALSALFLIPVFLVPALCSQFGTGYWPQAKHPENGRRLRFFFGLMPAGMALLVMARHALLFLGSWEVMTLAAFFLVSTEDEDPKVREAGWHYLVATHVGVLALFALFAVLRQATGSFDLGPVAPGVLSPSQLNAVFWLGLLGFGLKAGLMPLHVWLPGAHANAPSHVSATLSGVLLKMGIFGLVRVLGWLPTPAPWWGEVLLALGVVSGVLGVLFALGQHDIKRLLAYHSIENIGIIAMGVGLAVLGRSLGRSEWVVLGLAGGLLHVLNHALFKSLLFLCAGSVIHETHTREIDHLGGLAKRMPLTAAAFLVGSVAICGLPPLNGFVSELLIYLGLFRSALRPEETAWAGPAFAVPALALIGALAVACFVKVYGVMFLGEPRSDHAREATEAPASMTATFAVLAAAVAFIGLAPPALAPVLDRVVAAWAPPAPAAASVASLAPLGWISAAGFALLALFGIGMAWGRRVMTRGPLEQTVTWDCGYAAPSVRMQYTASSFAQILVDQFRWALWPRKHVSRLVEPFPASSTFHSDVPDLVLDRVLLTSWSLIERFAGKFRVLQQGLMQVYVLYIFATVLALLFWW